MSCHFYNREVDSAITLAGSAGDDYHAVQAQKQLQQSMQAHVHMEECSYEKSD